MPWHPRPKKYYNPVYPGETSPVKRVVNEKDFRRAFDQARRLSEDEPAFLRTSSWYRKGLIIEDPFDRFLAFWNSIEIVASKNHPDFPEAKKGSQSQIWECFKKLWGNCSQWPFISGQLNWIDDNYDFRIQIAHGTAPVDIEVKDLKSIVTLARKLKLSAILRRFV